MRILFFVLVIISTSGCSIANIIFAINKDTDGFLTFKGDSRVNYERGAEANAAIIANGLSEAISTIEEKQYGGFIKPVVVYLPSSIDSYSSYCVSRKSGACVLNKRLFISPKLKNTKDRIPRLLIHELSHLYMEQQLGMLSWHNGFPLWFREGLAVYASNGAGAENVSVSEAKQAIIENDHFIPNDSGSLFFPKGSKSFGMTHHMFYRQMGLFVSWLHQTEPGLFESLIKNIKDGKSFNAALQTSYNTTIESLWAEFSQSIKSKMKKVSIT